MARKSTQKMDTSSMIVIGVAGGLGIAFGNASKGWWPEEWGFWLSLLGQMIVAGLVAGGIAILWATLKRKRRGRF
jgi:hypothetical protein